MFLGFEVKSLLGFWGLRSRVWGIGVWGIGFKVHLNPKSMQNNSPKPIITAIKAIILHTFGVQEGF